MDSYDKDSVGDWLEVISRSGSKTDYGEDEKKSSDHSGITRLDEEIEISTVDESAVEHAYRFMTALSWDISQKNLNTEHLQFFLSFNGHSSTISNTALLDKNSPSPIISEKSNSVDLLINSCIHTSPGYIRKILFDRLSHLKSLEGVTIKEKFVSLT